MAAASFRGGWTRHGQKVERWVDRTRGEISVRLARKGMKSTAGVLASKLVVPAPRRGMVHRPRLIDQVAAGVRTRLTLLVAPAGFGKTTLLSAWCVSDSGRTTPHAWLSLDSSDGDPSRFWTHVIGALDQLCPGAGELAHALLSAPHRPSIEIILGSLINDLVRVDRDVVLILDDYHLVDAARGGEPRNSHTVMSVHAGLAFLLDHLPHRIHLVISTRSDPPLQVAKLRARGELVELRAADLKFELDETRAFFDQTMSLSLADADAIALEVRTEGWIAGLQLAGLALRHHATSGERSAFVTQFTGSDRFVVDYLAEEVLAHQPAPLQDFLLRTSILERLSGGLCDAVLDGTTGSQRVLEELEGASLFVIPLDRERHLYRYHQLFAEVLRARLKATHVETEIAELHARASAWFAAHHQPAEAIGHAVAGGNFERAAELIEHSFSDGVGAGLVRFVTIEQWLATLPEAVARASPALCFFRAARLLSLASMDVGGAEAWLDAAEAALVVRRAIGDVTPSDVSGEISWARSLLAAARGDAAGALAAGRAALTELKPNNIAGRCYAGIALSSAYVMRGELAQAEAVLVEAVMLARAAENISHANQTACSLSYVQRARGALRTATQTCENGLAWAGRRGPSGRIDLGPLLASLADLHCERNDLDAAIRYASEAVLASQQLGTPDQVALSTLVLARARRAQGDTAAAVAVLDDLAPLEPKVGWVAEIAAAIHVQLRPLVHAPPKLAHARDPLLRSRARLLPYVYEHAWIAPVAQLLARGDKARALEALDALESEADWLPWLRIKTLILRALAQHLDDDVASAMKALRSAVDLAEPEGFVRVFAEEGALLSPLLRAVRGQQRDTTFIDYVLAVIAGAAHAAAPVAGIIVPTLSSRELDVLRLMALGRSNAHIAGELIVATSTVKTHVNNIFGKLGVTTRAEAIARAHALKLV